MGDTEIKKYLINTYKLFKMDILKVEYHKSKTNLIKCLLRYL